MSTADTRFRDIVAVAREFCEMIELAGQADDAFWLKGMAQEKRS